MLISSWPVLPDYASVNWHEEGADLAAQALAGRRIGIEAGLWSGTTAAAAFARSSSRGQVLRVLAEVTDTSPATAPATATALLEEIGRAWTGTVLLHGEDDGAWPVLKLAARLRCDTRIGLEDVLTLPDGTRPRGNADLITAALRIITEPDQR